MNALSWRQMCWVLAAAALLSWAPVPAANAGIINSVLGDWDPDIAFGGFFRTETAFRITGDSNPYNQNGNIFNGVPVERTGASLGLAASTALFQDTVVRPGLKADNLINMQLFRFEADLDIDLFDNLKFESHIRAVFDPDLYEEYGPDAVRLADPIGPLHGEPNLFEYRYDSRQARFYSPDLCSQGYDVACEPQNANEAMLAAALGAEEGSSPLEWAGNEYLVDLPQFFLEYQSGGLFIRAGNQQIAWGDLIFFRIMDVVNALDLRRHSVLDLVSEEYSDKRLPALGVRVGYQLPFRWSVDAYVQRFRSTIFGNPNTPYNVIPTQFTVHDMYGQYDNEWNYGLRLRGNVGPVSVTLMANRHYNPFGAFHWTDSDVAQGLQPGGPAGLLAPGASGSLFSGLTDLLNNLGLGLTNNLTVPATGALLADSVFEVDPTGVTSAREFYTYAALARLNHFTGLNQAIVNFPAAQALTAQKAPTAEAQENQEDFFTQLSGGLRGHIRREYYRENNYGLSLGYRFEGPQDSLLFDQINLSLEMKYTPDKAVLTTINLDPLEPQRVDEFEIGFVAQKFVRYTPSFPAMFVVLQYYHRSATDLFNRGLDGYGGDPGAATPAARLPDGRSSWDAIAFAFQQPWPARIFRLDFAMLWDLKGGFLFQPAFRWTPNGNWRVQTFLTVVDTLYGEETMNALSTVGWADEFTVRVSYFF